MKVIDYWLQINKLLVNQKRIHILQLQDNNNSIQNRCNNIDLRLLGLETKISIGNFRITHLLTKNSYVCI